MKKIDQTEELLETAAYEVLRDKRPNAIEAIRSALRAGGSPTTIGQLASRVASDGLTTDMFYYAARYIKRNG